MKTFLIWLVVAAVFCASLGAWMSMMPGGRHLGGLAPLTEDQQTVAENLALHVDALASAVGARGPHQPQAQGDARDYLRRALTRAGLDVSDHAFTAGGLSVSNLEVTLVGTRRPDDVVVIGAHYDSSPGSPGADDNASGCAVLVELARAMSATRCERTIRFVLFANGAGTLAGNERSGGSIYAREARKRGDKIVAMLSLDSLGYYRDAAGSQKLPFPVQLAYPGSGNFVMFSGDVGSRELVRACVREFRKSAHFPSEGLAAPVLVSGTAASDDVGFRLQGYPAVVVTDTGVLRNDAIGTARDTPGRLDYQRMARVTAGLVHVVQALGRRATLL